MIDSPPICRVCARRGITELATWVMNDRTVTNWTLCDKHAQIVGQNAFNLRGALKQLPDATTTRQQSKENAQ